MLRPIALLAGFLLAFAVAAQVAAQRAEQIRHAVLIMGKPAGVQTATVAADGTHEYTFEFNDRGRGPKLTSRIRLDENGIPIRVQTSGNDYLKAPVSERFSIVDGVASWENGSESGHKELSSQAFYVSLHSVPAELALLANALLKAPGMRLPLLPSGEASIRRTGEMTLKNGTHSRRVISYEITGLGFRPATIWLDSEGGYFAEVDSWSSFVLEGWEASAAKLLAQQDARQERRTRELARSLTHKPSGPLVITNANLFDAATGRSTPGTTVVIEGNRIRSVGADATVAIPQNAQTIDAHGKALLPGLWDMHVHVSANDGLMHIAAGVTSVRDLANDNDLLQATRKRIDAGQEIGPRIMMRGVMDGRGKYTAPTKVLVDTEEEARTAVANYDEWGYEGIKIYSSIKPGLVPTIIRFAHQRGMRVSGHVPAFMTARQFIEAGADEVQHINFVFLNFFDDVKETRTPARFTAVAERAALLDLDSQRVRSFVKLLKERGTVVDPTVTVFYSMFTDRPGTISAAYAPIAERLPPLVRRGLLAGGLPVPEGMDKRYRESAQALLRMIKVLYDAGIPLVAGTDEMPGFTLHRELELYVQAGIPAPAVLSIATLGAARVMRRDGELGSIAPGKLADLILIDGDPARHIDDIRNTALVIKDGNLYEPDELYRAIGVAAGGNLGGSG